MEIIEENSLVSVLIPIYKVENYLARCLESVICQTYKNIEIITVIQPCEDNSESILREYAKKDGRIKIYNQQRPDLATARNRLIQEANGTYVCFVDSDDLIATNYVEELVSAMKTYDADVIQTKCFSFHEVDQIKEESKNNNEGQVFSGKEFTYGLIAGVYGSEASVCQCKLSKKSLFEDIYYPENQLCEDVSTTYRVLWNANKVVLLDYSGYYYQSSRKDSIIHDVLSKKRFWVDGVNAMAGRIDFFVDKDDRLVCLSKYVLLNELMRIQCQWKGCIEEKSISDLLKRKNEYCIDVLRGDIGIKYKTVAFLSTYFKDVSYLIWKCRRHIIQKKEWSKKGE